MHNNFEIYLKQRDFSKKEFLDWIEKIFIIKGYQNSKLEKGTNNDFLELNPIMRLFSIENAKKFEDKFGKEWWKK